MFRRRWESWVVYERDGAKVGERFLRRHFTERAAFGYAADVASDPQLLVQTVETMLAGQRAILVNPDARERRGAADCGGHRSPSG